MPEEIFTIDFDDSAKFILFIGTPRSGHSIVGAILDAHPLAIISHEVNALERIAEGVKGEDLFSMIIENSAKQASSGRGQSEADLAAGYGKQLFHRVWRYLRQPRLSKPKPYSFDYEITGQSQGIIGGPLRVIGDKKGGGTTKILSRNPNLLRKLQEEVELPLCLIHVIRDPYDNISTMARRTDNQIGPQIRGFGRLSEQINSITEDSGLPIYKMYHEDFVSSPEKEIREICRWLNLPTDSSFIDACSSIVYEKPHRSRDLVEWDDKSKASVEEIISRWPILHRYSDKNS